MLLNSMQRTYSVPQIKNYLDQKKKFSSGEIEKFV